MRPSWIEIDLDAVEHNVAQISAAIGEVDLCAVVKADAYGHGDVPVAEAAIRGGASWLAVALVEEGVRLREADIDIPILVLSEPRLSEVRPIVTHGLTPTAYRTEFVEHLALAALNASTLPYPVHLKLDTGMHRVGASPVEALEIARKIDQDDRLVLQGVFTHFPVADEDPQYTGRQNNALIDFVAALEAEGIEPKIVHAANTAAAFDLPDTRHRMCRVGLGIYGLRPHPESGMSIDLKPAMRVVSHVAYVRDLSVGARPSYGRRRPLTAAGRVATVPIGYADGVPRRLLESGVVLINEERYSFAGTVTMDMVVVDVGQDDVNVGDEVVLMGQQGDDAITAQDWADLLDTISYEVVCDFGPRLPRRYIGGTVDG
ncbi:MAG: alanine racemase [Actinobacteria bacterium]|nr:MAG: alanine racemase [Actinomycetota bacterium]